MAWYGNDYQSGRGGWGRGAGGEYDRDYDQGAWGTRPRGFGMGNRGWGGEDRGREWGGFRPGGAWQGPGWQGQGRGFGPGGGWQGGRPERGYDRGYRGDSPAPNWGGGFAWMDRGARGYRGESGWDGYEGARGPEEQGGWSGRGEPYGRDYSRRGRYGW